MNQTASPLVSVILTAYERTQYLSECIKGVLGQSLTSIEVFVADDSNSKEIMRELSKFSDTRLRYCPNPVRLGIAGSLRHHLQQAKGKFVSILNDDDIWEPNFLQVIVENLEKDSELILGFSEHYIINESGRILEEEGIVNSRKYGRADLREGVIEDFSALVLNWNAIPLAMASVFRRDAFQPHYVYDQVRGAYDFWISILLASTDRKAYFTPLCLTRYRRHSSSETARAAPDKLDNMVFIYQKALEMGLLPKYSKLLTNRAHEFLWRSGKNYLRFGHRREGLLRIGNSFRYGISLRALFCVIICILPKSLGLTVIKRISNSGEF